MLYAYLPSLSVVTFWSSFFLVSVSVFGAFFFADRHTIIYHLHELLQLLVFSLFIALSQYTK